MKLLIEAIGDTIEDDDPDIDNCQQVELTDIDYTSNYIDNTQEEFHDATDNNITTDEWTTTSHSRAPDKGEPPPTIYYLKNETWLHNVIHTIYDDNDNIICPYARIIFEDNNLPTINLITKSDIKTILLEEIDGDIINIDDIPTQMLPDTMQQTYGQVINEQNIQKQIQDNTIPIRPISYICDKQSKTTNKDTRH